MHTIIYKKPLIIVRLVKTTKYETRPFQINENITETPNKPFQRINTTLTKKEISDNNRSI